MVWSGVGRVEQGREGVGWGEMSRAGLGRAGQDKDEVGRAIVGTPKSSVLKNVVRCDDYTL